MSYSTVGLPVRAALAATGRFDRVELRRGRRWSDWSLLVTLGDVEAELAFVGLTPRAEGEARPAPQAEDGGEPPRLRLVPQVSPGRVDDRS